MFKYGNNTLILTPTLWAKTNGPELTANCNNSEDCATCHHAKWYELKVMLVAT
jgi:hypothetical protein